MPPAYVKPYVQRRKNDAVDAEAICEAVTRANATRNPPRWQRDRDHAGNRFGLVNGFGIAMLGISPIVMTLAMNGILQGIALLYSQGTPAGFSAPLCAGS